MANAERERVTFITPVVRVVYPYLTKPDTGRKDSSEKYGVTLLIPKNDVWNKEFKELRQKIIKVARTYFNKPDLTLDDFTHPFHDGDEDDKEMYKGHYRMSARSQFKPGIATPEGRPMSDEDGALIKGGDYGRAVLSIYGYTVKGKKGVTCGLEVFQFSHKGDPIGGGSREAQIKLLGKLDIPLGDPDLDDEEDYEEDLDEEVVPKAAKKASKVVSKGKTRIEIDEGDEIVV